MEQGSGGVRLITSVGAGRYAQIRYGWNGQEEISPYACVAMARLLDLAGAGATVILTDAARDAHWPALSQALKEAGLRPELVRVPDGRTEAEHQEIIEAVMAHVLPGERIVLDVTLGLRHLPFAYLAALTYLVGLQRNRLQGIFYGAFELKDASGTAPILDLTRLFRLVEWYQALGAAEETGDLRPVARRLRQEAGELFRRAQGSPQLSQAADSVERLSQALAVGIPLEIGLEVTRAVEALERLQQLALSGGPALRVLRRLDQELRNGQWGGFFGSASPATKEAIVLDEHELRRQLTLARWYGERNDHAKVVFLLREWMVNLTLWGSGQRERWLQRKARQQAERRLNTLRHRVASGVATDGEKELAALWDRITSRRNPVAHAGMTAGVVRPVAQRDEARELLKACEALLSAPPTFPSEAAPDRGRLLISPLGLSPGVLFTAVHHLAPVRLLLLTSKEAVPRVDEALARARRPDLERRILLLEDPFTGFGELPRLLDRGLLGWLAHASEVVVNVTGGSTVMQFVVERLADESRRFGIATRRCALVDRRPVNEQRADPYVLGELVWLDEPPHDPRGDDGDLDDSEPGDTEPGNAEPDGA